MHKHNQTRCRKDDKNVGLSNKVLQFIEDKSRYAHSLNSTRLREHLDWSCWLPIENLKDYYAVTPPMDYFMGVNAKEALDHVWNGFEKGDVVIGRISSIREHGMSLLLLTLDCGKARDIDRYKIRAWCPISEIPKNTNHEDVLLRFQDKDLVRCVITDVDVDENELVVSLFLPSRWREKEVTFGKIDEDSLPISYRRKIICEEPYENILYKSVAFANPNNVEYLLSRLKIPEKSLVSLMPKLHKKDYPRGDFAEPLRKRQGKKIADCSVKKGVERFKSNNYPEALQDFNYALEMDCDNVDALVARGALYANRSSYTRAIADFESALKLEHGHKNAKKYLVQVLVERAQQIEGQMSDLQQVREAERCYQKALRLDHNCMEAKKALGEIQLQKEKEQKAEERKKVAKKSSPETSSHQQEDKYAATAEKLRMMLTSEKIVKETLPIHNRNVAHSKTKTCKKRRGRKRKRKKSPSSSDSTSSSSSSSGSGRKERRKRRSLSSSTSSSSTPSSSSTSSSSSSSSSTSYSDEGSKHSKKHKTNGCKNPDLKRSDRSREKDSNRSRIDSTSSSVSRRRSDSSKRSLDGDLENARCHPQVTIRSEDQKYKYKNRDTHGGHRKSSESMSRTPEHTEHAGKLEKRRHSANFSKITKDNFNDIMKEISAFETSTKKKK